MSVRYIRPTKIKDLAHILGRRVEPGYLAWLDAYVERLVRRHAHKLRGTVTLRAADAAALTGESGR